MELGHLLTRSSLTYPKVSSKACLDLDSFCQLGNSVSLPWVIYYEAFYLHGASSFSYTPVIYLKLVLFLIHLQFLHLFCNQSKCNLGSKVSPNTAVFFKYSLYWLTSVFIGVYMTTCFDPFNWAIFRSTIISSVIANYYL
jgi:hypothetical protein